MKKSIMFCLIAAVPILFSCRSWNKKNKGFSVRETLVLYSDSTYQQPVDSLYIEGRDTIFYNEKFPVKGYCRVDPYEEVYSQGKVYKDQKRGKWQTFQKESDSEKPILIQESYYNEFGYLHGTNVLYHPETGKPSGVHSYNNGEEEGLQKLFYPSGELYMKYEKDREYNYINTFAVYTKQGEELYSVDLGEKGTGYIKFYDRDNHLEWEGGLVNKRREGWHKVYVWDLETNKDKLAEKLLFKNDRLLFRTLIVFSWDVRIPEYKGNKIDSVTYEYTGKKTEIKYYYKGGTVIKKRTDRG
jgi:hypothetical protein